MGRNRGKGCGICGDPVYAKGLCKKHHQQRQSRQQIVRVPRVIRRERRRNK